MLFFFLATKGKTYQPRQPTQHTSIPTRSNICFLLFVCFVWCKSKQKKLKKKNKFKKNTHTRTKHKHKPVRQIVNRIERSRRRGQCDDYSACCVYVCDRR